MKKTLVFLSLCLLLVGVGCAVRQKTAKITYYNGDAVFYEEWVAVGEDVSLEEKSFPNGTPEHAENGNTVYLFNGWGYSPNGDPVKRLTVKRDVSLHALYRLEHRPEVEYTVTFAAQTDEGEIILSEVKVPAGGTVQAPENPVRTGYTFKGWDRDLNLPVTGRLKINAVFEKNRYALRCHVLGQTVEESVEYGAALHLPTPQLAPAFRFVSWCTDKGSETLFSQTSMPANDLDVFARCEIDFTSARLKLPEHAVYGDEAAVRILGLPQAEGLTLSYAWQDGSTQPELSITGVGEHPVSVTISASYPAGELSGTVSLSGVVTVERRPLSLALQVPAITYGEEFFPVLTAEGYDELPFEPSYRALSEEGEELARPLPAGNYTLELSFEGQENYDFAPPSAQLIVRKRPLTVYAQAQEINYGNQPSPTLRYEGFLEGEGESVLSCEGNPFLYTGNVHGDRFGAGVYTLSADVSALSARNYALTAGEATSFEVKKAPLTVTAVMEKTELVYGETPEAHIEHTPFVYPDEQDAAVFGRALAPVYSAQVFSVGEYTVRTGAPEETENYAITEESARFTVSPKTVSVSLAPLRTTFGDEFSFPSPTLTGIVPGEEELAEGLKAGIALSLRLNEQPVEKSRFLRVGTYTVEISAQQSEGNYVLSCENGTLTVEKRGLSIASGEVSQNRNRPWRHEVVLSGEEAALFDAEGVLILNTTDAGRYFAEEEKALAENNFVWQTPLKISLKGGEDVTDQFEVKYALSVTLNNSRFSVTVPSSGLTFVYDAAEHTFETQVALEEEDVSIAPTLVYRVNGREGAPTVRDAGEYEIVCEISAQNYETEQRSYKVTVQKASYTLLGTREDCEAVYNGSAHGEALSLRGAEGDLSRDLKVSVAYTPNVGVQASLSGAVLPIEAGTYVYSYAADENPNYEPIAGSFTVTVSRAEYGVRSEDQVYTYSPGASFGKGVEVEAVRGNAYTVSYRWEGGSGEEAPVFHGANEGVDVAFTVSESNNYASKSGSYRVSVLKAKGELNVDGVRKDYVYNGQEQRVESGAVSNNLEDGRISYENNVFTTVAQGNALAVRITLSEGANYTGDEKTVSITVEKQKFSFLPVEAPRVAEQFVRRGRTLASVALPENFRWVEPLPLAIGNHTYSALYSPDEENIEPFRFDVGFSARKEKVRVSFIGCEQEIGKEITEYARFLLTGEDNTSLEAERECVTMHVTEEVDETVGGTYAVVCTVDPISDDYFVLEGPREGTVPFKLKSVEVEGTLYTVEDALLRLESGTAKVTADTAFLSPEQAEALGVYADENCRKVRLGATLLLPYGEEDTGEVAQNAKLAQSPIASRGYVSLSLSGTLNVEGTLIVNAKRSSDSQKTSMIVGSAYATLELQSGATLTVGEGGVFECMGITCGEGEVRAESGSTVYEPFSMVGWKGGSISAAVRYEVFPLNQYALTSLCAKTVFSAGAHYVLRACLTATLNVFGGEQNLNLTVDFLGGESAFLDLQNGEAIKEIESGKICFTGGGDLTFRNLSMQLSGALSFDTQGLQMPIPGNFSLRLKSGSRAEIPEKVALKLLPGAELVIEEGAELCLTGGSLLAYSGNETFDGVSAWRDGGNGLGYPHAALAQAYRNPPAEFGYTNTTSAILRVDGTLKTTEGSTLAARLTGTGEGEIAQGTVLTTKVKEDNTPAITGTFDKLQALSGKGGKFFTATLSARKGEEPLTEGAFSLQEA